MGKSPEMMKPSGGVRLKPSKRELEYQSALDAWLSGKTDYETVARKAAKVYKVKASSLVHRVRG